LWGFLVQNAKCQLSTGMQQFTNSLLLSSENSEVSNFVVSPYSLHSVFTALMLGSKGTTRSELGQVLGISDDPEILNSYAKVTDEIDNGESKLQISNLLALNKGFKPKFNYTIQLNNLLNSEVREYDFEGQAASSVEKINEYVAERTNDKIDELLQEGDIDSLTRMILVNAVYFKGVWKYQFDPEDTDNLDFQSVESRVINTPFMYREARVRVLDDEDRGVEILELPYSDSSKSMLFVVPKQGESSSNIAAKLLGLDLGKIRALPAIGTDIRIPKFNMKYQTPLKDKMTKLGAGKVFTTSADLTHISDLPLYATGGVHQAFIEVNEEGTEAAAATAVQVGLRTATARNKRQFIADKPFLFMIYDFDHNVPLFAGKVVDPSRAEIITRLSAIPDVEKQIVAPSADKEGTSTESGSKCVRLLRDFPNALDNFRICRDVANDGKFLDWLRNNRELCEASQDHYETFMEEGCDEVWCRVAAKKNSKAWQTQLTNDCAKVTADNKQLCKNLENKIKAISHLNCSL